jgi:hypothetical protein
MGMTYDDLGIYGRLRKVARCGPVAMYRRCLALWRGALAPDVVADKVGREGAGRDGEVLASRWTLRAFARACGSSADLMPASCHLKLPPESHPAPKHALRSRPSSASMP